MIRVSAQHQTAVVLAACVCMRERPKTTFGVVDHLGNTFMTTQPMHSNLNVGQTGLVAR